MSEQESLTFQMDNKGNLVVRTRNDDQGHYLMGGGWVPKIKMITVPKQKIPELKRILDEATQASH